MKNKRNYIITGGCGFIGTAVVANLLKDPENRIRILDNLSENGSENLSQLEKLKVHRNTEIPKTWENKLELIIGDICDFNMVLNSFSGASACIHLAANTGVGPSVQDPFKDCNNNVLGTLNCLEAANRHNLESFVFASSGAPLGVQTPPLNEELAPRPASPYGASKMSGEGYCSAFFHSFGLNTVSLRFGNVYGPGSSNKNSVIAKFIRQAIALEELVIFGTGLQTRDFIFIDDIVDAIICSTKAKNIGGETFQIASSKEVTILEVAEMIKNEFLKANIDFPKIKFSDPRTGDVLRNFSNTAKAEKLLGWKPGTDLEIGLGLTVRYFLQHSK